MKESLDLKRQFWDARGQDRTGRESIGCCIVLALLVVAWGWSVVSVLELPAMYYSGLFCSVGWGRYAGRVGGGVGVDAWLCC